MHLITALAIKKRTITLLAVVLLLVGGVFTYNSLQVELFPEIEFPLVAVVTSYPSVDPEGVVEDVTSPIERAISGTQGLESIQSTSLEGNSIVLANFRFGTDMANAESNIESAVNGLSFPSGVNEPTVGRFSPEQAPVIQLGVVSDQGLSVLGPVVETQVVPRLSSIDGVLDVRVSGDSQRQVQVSVDPELMRAVGVSLPQISAALSENNVSPYRFGLILDAGQAVPVRTGHTLNSVEDIRNLVVGLSTSGPVILADVATVDLTDGIPTSISRTNGKPSVGVSVIKESEANTIEVADAVRQELDSLTGLPPGVEIIIVSDQGPEIQEQIDTLLNEAGFGFLFAVAVVFFFMLTLRPTVRKGLFTNLAAHHCNWACHPPQRLERGSSDGMARHDAKLHDPRWTGHIGGQGCG